MTEPSGKIVARPMVVRACGHEQEFQHYAVDKYRAQRQAKFQRTRCAACAAKLVEEQKRAAEALPTKGEALKSLPSGTTLTLSRGPDGSWAGTLSAEAQRSRPLELRKLVRSRLWSRWPDFGSRNQALARNRSHDLR